MILDEVSIAVYRAADAVGDLKVALRRWGRNLTEHDPDILPRLNERGRALDAYVLACPSALTTASRC